MGVLSTVLDGLRSTDVTLEEYDRRGDCVRRVGSSDFLAAVQHHRAAFRDGDVDGRRVVALLFRPEEAIEFLVVTLAAMAEGWTVVPLYPNWDDETQVRYLEAYDLRGIAVGTGFLGRAESWLVGTAPIEKIFEISLDEGIPPLPDGPLQLFDMMRGDQPCAWIFTSGTSGELAKLTEITLSNLEAAIDNIRDLDFVRPGMTLHNPLSTSHIFAFSVVLGLLAVKPKRLLFSDVQFLARLPQTRTGKVDALILVPIVLNRLRAGFYEKIVAQLDRKSAPPELRRLARVPMGVRRRLKQIVQRAEEAVIDREQGRRIGLRRRGSILTARRLFGRMLRERLGSPEFVVIGGAKPNLRAMAFLEALGIRCLQGWGMTETTGPLAVCRLRDRFRGAFGTCGTLFPDTKAYVEDGELIVEGPQIARGYHQPSGEFVPFNGRKSTGDHAEFDAVGRLRVTGKASDRITTDNGLNYNPIPFEERLTALDLDRGHVLADVIVIGDGKPRLGAVFFLREGVDDEASVREQIASLLEEFNRERAVDERIEAWALCAEDLRTAGFLGPSGKVVRRRIETHFADIFARWAVEVE